MLKLNISLILIKFKKERFISIAIFASTSVLAGLPPTSRTDVSAEAWFLD